MTKLWEVKHPYYATPGNFFANDCHTEFKSWGEFISAEGDSDMDYNFVYRWDWHEGEDHELLPYNGDDYYRNGELLIFFVGQRKALLRSVAISVCRADEPAVREWLDARFQHLRLVWAPFA